MIKSIKIFNSNTRENLNLFIKEKIIYISIKKLKKRSQNRSNV